MDWMHSIGSIIGRYTGSGGGAAAAPDNVPEDFRQVAQAAPHEVVAGGLSQSFRSDQTPPFPHMLATLFERSDPNQKAGLLNRLLQHGGGGSLASLPGLGGLAGLLGGGQVSAEQASQISPEHIQQIAEHAERQNPSVVDEVSSFYAQHPHVVQAVGGLALSVALQHMLRQR